MTNKTQQVESKIRELIPSLKKLEFGAKLRGKITEDIYTYLSTDSVGNYRTKENGRYNVNSSEIELIGLPITLEVVTEAVGIYCEEYKTDRPYSSIILEIVEEWIYNKPFTDQTNVINILSGVFK